MKVSTKSYDAVVAGYLGVDIAPAFAAQSDLAGGALFQPGKLIETKGISFSLGGVVANTGLALKRFGCNTAFMGCVGNDVLGDIALAQFKDAGVGGGIRRLSDARTGSGIVLAPPGMDRMFLEDPGCNRTFTDENIDFDVVRQSRLFHFGYPPLMDALWANDGVCLKALLAKVRACGTLVSLDMSLPDPDSPAGKADWGAILTAIAPLVDIFVPSIEELLFMMDPERYDEAVSRACGGDILEAFGPDVVEEVAERALGMGIKAILVKAGHKGAYLRTGSGVGIDLSASSQIDLGGCPAGVWLDPCPEDSARVCNASGAGDCAIAGFLAALLKGEDIVTAGAYGMMAGRDNLYGSDAISGLTDWEVMRQQMACLV